MLPAHPLQQGLGRVAFLDPALQVGLGGGPQVELRIELASEALSEMEEGDERSEILASLDPRTGAQLLQELADDDAADLIAELEPEDANRILANLPVDEAGDLRDVSTDGLDDPGRNGLPAGTWLVRGGRHPDYPIRR